MNDTLLREWLRELEKARELRDDYARGSDLWKHYTATIRQLEDAIEAEYLREEA